MTTRGTYQFEVQANGNLVNNTGNIELARRLFRDGTIISGRWGPGRPGDFDYGGWHCLCHLAAGAGVYLLGNQYLWVSITHAEIGDKYIATVSTRVTGGNVRIIELGSAEGHNLTSGANTNMGLIMELSESPKLHISFGPPCKTEFSIYEF